MNNLLLNLKVIFCWIQNPTFIIKRSEGSVTKIKGNVKSSFLVDCADITKLNGLKSGVIYGVAGQFGKPILKAYNIPKEMLQQLRNSWGYNS